MENLENVDALCEACMKLLSDEHDAFFVCTVCGQASCAKCPGCYCGDED